MANSDIFTLDEVSDYLKVPKGTIYKMCKAGKLPSFKAGKRVRFRKDSIDKWISEEEEKRVIKLPILKKLKEEVKQIISDITRVQISEITDMVDIRNGLGVDSLQAMEILVAIEQKYGIKIDEAKAFDIVTFADLIQLAKEYTKSAE